MRWNWTSLFSLSLLCLASPGQSQIVTGTGNRAVDVSALQNYFRGTGTNAQDLIIDTDLGGGDIDDFHDLWIAHQLMRSGELNLLAVTHNTTNGYACPTIEVVNASFGRGDIPVGQIEFNPLYTIPDSMTYQQTIATNLDFYNMLNFSSNAPSAMQMLVYVLSKRPSRSVNMLYTGSLMNLSNLWSQQRSLMLDRVKRVIIVAGTSTNSGGATDFNLNQAPLASAIVHQMYPMEIVWCGVEVGWPVIIGSNYVYKTDNTGPLYKAMAAYGQPARSAWSSMALLWLARGTNFQGSNLFNEVTVGTNFVNAGTNMWLGTDRTHQRYLVRAANSNDFQQTLDRILFRPLPIRLAQSSNPNLKGVELGGVNVGAFVSDLVVTENIGAANSGVATFKSLTYSSHIGFGANRDTYIRGGKDGGTLNLNDITTLGAVNTGVEFVSQTAGKGISIKEGSNARMGTATLSSGKATVSTTVVTASSRIFLTARATANPVSAVCETNRVNGTSFQINSASATDANAVSWLIFEPSP